MQNINNIISINFPLRGEWQFLRPPGHHPFAFDFVKMDKKRKKYSKENKIKFFLSHIPSTQYYCWNQDVFAPIDGTVLLTGDGWQDNEKTSLWKTIKIWYLATYRSSLHKVNGRLDLRPNVGNFVMIKASAGHIVFLAHLKNGSITVEEGQYLKEGEVIAKVGNSGNSTAPHLHINLFDQMDDPFKAKVLPFVFTEYEQLSLKAWVKYSFSLPKPKVFIKL